MAVIRKNTQGRICFYKEDKMKEEKNGNLL